LLGAFASKICDKEHSSATLGDSEEAAVQDSPRNVTRPDVDQRVDDRSKVSPTVRGEGSGDVFPDGEVGLAVRGSKLANNSNCLMEQTAPLSSKARTLTGDRKVLAGRAEGDDVYRLKVVRADEVNVIVQLGVREAQSQHRLRLLVDLARPSGAKSRTLKTKVEAADAGKQRADGERHFLPFLRASTARLICARTASATQRERLRLASSASSRSSARSASLRS